MRRDDDILDAKQRVGRIIAEAAELVEYGAKYYIVGMMYSHFSKKQAEATVEDCFMALMQ